MTERDDPLSGARVVAEAVTILGLRGQQGRHEGLAALHAFGETLTAVSQRLCRTQPARVLAAG